MADKDETTETASGSGVDEDEGAKPRGSRGRRSIFAQAKSEYFSARSSFKRSSNYEKRKTELLKIEGLQEELEKVYSHDDDSSFVDILDTMLFGCCMVYSFASLRKLAREYEMEKEDLIKADTGTIDMHFDRIDAFSGKLGKNVTANEVHEFMEANKDFIDSKDRELNSDLCVKSIMGLSVIKNLFISDFDDEFNETSLVYGISVNGDHKRITIVFRGSVTGNNDWGTNLQANKVMLHTPEMLTKLGFDENKVIKVHGGFKSYLIDCQEPPHNDTKITEIVDNLMEIYSNPDFKDFSLYVTGHSLGGALSTLLSFKLATDERLATVLQGPVTNISFASPLVGDEVFKEAFQVLERNKKVLHFRVSNSHDVIPTAPPLPGFVHTGVNLHFWSEHEKGYELKSDNDKGMWSQLSTDPLTRHGLGDYYSRKLAMKDTIGGKTIEEIYYDESINLFLKADQENA